MKKRIANPWRKMSLAARVMLVSGIVLVIVSGTIFTLTTKNEIEYQRQVLKQTIAYELNFLTPAIAESAVTGDYALIQDMLTARVGQPSIGRASWTDSEGNRLQSVSEEELHSAPAWFARWINIPDFRQTREVKIGGEFYGTLEVRGSPAPTIDHLWESLRNRFTVLVIGIFLLYGAIIIILSRGMRPLYALKDAAIHFGKGDYRLRVNPSGPPEMQACVHAFNTMASNIERLMDSLHGSSARNRLLAIIVEQSNVPIVTKDLQGIVTSWNPAATALYGYTAEEMIGKPTGILHVDGSGVEFEETLARVRSAQASSFEARRLAKDGTILEVSISVSPLYDEDNRHIGEIAISRDITRQKHAEEALSKEKERAQVTLASIADAVVTTDIHGCIDYLNPVAEKLLGCFSEEAYGRPLMEIFRCVDETNGQPIPDPVGQVLNAPHTLEFRGEAILTSSSGNSFPIEHSAAAITSHDDDVIGVVLVFRDVSASRNMASQLSWQASHDALTALVNRHEFELRLHELIDTADTQGRKHALLYMDLDQFKVVNDTCGHGAGDELLRQLSSVLDKRVRSTDTIARLGGDEFGVLLVDCPLETATGVAETLRQAVSDFRFIWQDKIFAMGVSIGVISISGKRENNTDVMAAADAACATAKEQGRNQVHASENASELSQRRGEMQWVARINSAFENNRFRLYYQRIVAIQEVEATPHYEVLVRMMDEEGKIVPPMHFIPAAERFNLMRALDRRVIAMAFDEYAQHTAEFKGVSPLISINLSGDSLSDPLFLDFLKKQFANHAVDPRSFCFEVTETAAIANLERANKLIGELREMGCRFSLDDFGSGLSSFGYLKSLPVDFLKIDGAFVKDMAQNQIDTAMVDAINNIGHVMGIKTIAEWVEDRQTLEVLKRVGIDYAQGYFFDRPKPWAELRAQQKEAMAGF